MPVSTLTDYTSFLSGPTFFGPATPISLSPAEACVSSLELDVGRSIGAPGRRHCILARPPTGHSGHSPLLLLHAESGTEQRGVHTGQLAS